MPTLLEHLNWRVKQRRHLARARAVLATPPLVPRDDGVVLFSMVGGAVVLPYLVAAKSFARALGRGRVVVMDDGTLSGVDRALLVEHLAAEIVPIAGIDTGFAPRGGTWERLLAILDRRADDYVIQLDSDTLTLGEPVEVRAAIDANRSFSLRGEAGAELMEVDAFAASLPPRRAPLHIQHAAERAIGDLQLPECLRPRYFRGCSGFAGFARGGRARTLALAFSQTMQEQFGAARWAEWGTEQVTSNFVIANEPDPLLLPYVRYRNFWSDGVPSDVALVHFVGTHRYTGRTYLDATDRAIASLTADQRA